jgi:hypothetical protein
MADKQNQQKHNAAGQTVSNYGLMLRRRGVTMRLDPSITDSDKLIHRRDTEAPQSYAEKQRESAATVTSCWLAHLGESLRDLCVSAVKELGTRHTFSRSSEFVQWLPRNISYQCVAPSTKTAALFCSTMVIKNDGK